MHVCLNCACVQRVTDRQTGKPSRILNLVLHKAFRCTQRGIQRQKHLTARPTGSASSVTFTAVLTALGSAVVLIFVRSVRKTLLISEAKCGSSDACGAGDTLTSAEWLSLICPCCEAAEVVSAARSGCFRDEKTGVWCMQQL